MIGRQFGRRKLLPKVSPNKTVEGFVGGILSAGGSCYHFLDCR